MTKIVIDLLLVSFLYTILLAIIMKNKWKKDSKGNSDDDDDGGLPVALPPDLDLPPGICLPGDPIIKKETEEVLA